MSWFVVLFPNFVFDTLIDWHPNRLILTVLWFPPNTNNFSEDFNTDEEADSIPISFRITRCYLGGGKTVEGDNLYNDNFLSNLFYLLFLFYLVYILRGTKCKRKKEDKKLTKKGRKIVKESINSYFNTKNMKHNSD